LRLLLEDPAFEVVGVWVSRARPELGSVFTAMNRLRDAGVLRPLTDRKRDQVWSASLALNVRIVQAST
jgi:hypothetical protein